MSEEAESGNEVHWPAFDPEPPPPRRWRRYRWVVALMVVAGAGAGLVVFIATSSTGSPAGASGEVLVQTPSGALGLVHPGEAKVQLLSSLSAFDQGPNSIPPFATEDGRYAVTANGRVLGLSSSGVTVLSLQVRLGPPQDGALVAGLTDHDTAAVVLTQPANSGSSLSNVSVVPLGKGAPQSFGIADGVDADPQQPGVFVSVPSSAPPPASTSVTRLSQVDLSVDLRDEGQKPVVLATAAELDRDLGLSPTTEVALLPTRDPSGDRVAIIVQTAVGDNEGLVVFDRTGHLIAVVPPTVGMASDSAVTWSPDGRAIAFFTFGGPAQSSKLDVWYLSGQSSVQREPVGAGAGQCLWSGDSTTLLCSVTGFDKKNVWLLANTEGKPMRVVPAAGFPIAWLPEPAGPSS